MNKKFTNIGDEAITIDEYYGKVKVNQINLTWNHNARYWIVNYSDVGKIIYGNSFEDRLPKKWLGELLL